MRKNHFIVYSVFASSLILSACGGGADSLPSSVANSANDPAAVAKAGTRAPSPNGTTIPSGTSIVDSSNAVWTVTNGVIYRAGQKAGFSQAVIQLLWYGGKIYQQNVNKLWWVWQNNTWATSSDPRTATAASASASTAIPFFGVNAHYIQGGVYSSIPLATQSATMVDLGLTSVRQDVYSNAQIDILADKVMPNVGSKVNVMPLVIPHPWMDPTLNGRTPTEASAYTYAYNMAAYAATRFKGVPVVEFGNEYDIDEHNQRIANDGVNVSDYDNNTWPIWRGTMRGSYDGWRSVDKSGQTKIINTASTGFLNLGWYKGMLTGTQPDGSTGHPKVPTDILQLHWYSDGLDPVNTWGKDGTNYNVLKILHDAYNLPIMFTEIGINADFSTAKAQAYISKTIPELYAARSTYNVIGFNWYELYDDPSGEFGILTNGGSNKAVYSTVKAAVAASK
ncbi:beta-glucosidase [Caballeronia grimmiae]|jgi:hypothetical protein|uniref:Beta-glucosidase n=1 Tax=Caballeronia grimmiae TaxID=1071679 RepID=A0A069P3U0_9BURK|nr:beta-glucosidase [Caballeronia grimmiae]KDR34559.1 beta-glucosidase [Caballeronia grimmiae]GGD80876.1 hypothetical protein GCM10010985_39200 [Caballeronia grimmiae]